MTDHWKQDARVIEARKGLFTRYCPTGLSPAKQAEGDRFRKMLDALCEAVAASVRPVGPTREQVEALRRKEFRAERDLHWNTAIDAVLALFPPPGATPTTETP